MTASCSRSPRRRRRSPTPVSTAPTTPTASASSTAPPSAGSRRSTSRSTSCATAGPSASRRTGSRTRLVDSASGQIAITLGYRGPELRDRLGLCDRLACGRGRRRADPAGLGGRSACRRDRVRHHPGRSWRASARCAASPPRRSIPRALLVPSTRPGRGSSWGRGPRRSSSKSWRRRARVARRSMPRCSGTGRRTTRTTWLRQTRSRSESRR